MTYTSKTKINNIMDSAHDDEPKKKKPRTQAQIDALTKNRKKKGKAAKGGKKKSTILSRPDGDK